MRNIAVHCLPQIDPFKRREGSVVDFKAAVESALRQFRVNIVSRSRAVDLRLMTTGSAFIR